MNINNDFRQISVLPQVAKVLERIQLKLNPKDLSVNASQHAFTADRSTMTALASITQDWYNATDSGSLYNGMHVVFVDFRKALDLVDHGVLLTKLAGMGITNARAFGNGHRATYQAEHSRLSSQESSPDMVR